MDVLWKVTITPCPTPNSFAVDVLKDIYDLGYFRGWNLIYDVRAAL